MIAEEIRGLMEAYSQVHTPDPVYIAAELWVSACIEEGVDFSQYTLDEITEEFIIDMNSEDLSESLLSEILGMPGAQDLGANVRQQFGKARRAVGSAIGNVAKGAADVAGAYGQGFAGQKTTSKNPLARAYNAASRFVSAPARATASFGAGLVTGKSASKPGASPAPTKSKFGTTTPKGSSVTSTGVTGLSAADRAAYSAGGGNAAAQRGMGKSTADVIAQGRKNLARFDSGPRKGNPNIVGSPVVGSKKPPIAAAKPAAPAATKPTAPAAAKPTAPAAKPAGSAMDQFAKANPKLAASAAERDRTRGTSATTNPLMKDMKANLPAPKSPAPSTAKTGFDLAKKGVNLAASVDIFDLVKGHLLDEGYADTEDAALAIMANMSEEWKQSILEG